MRDYYKTHIEPHLEIIERWCREGATDVEISSKLGIARSTLTRYRQIKPELLDAMTKARELADMRVQAGLYRRACGYTYDEITYKPALQYVVKEIMKQAKAGNITISVKELEKKLEQSQVPVCRVRRSVPPDTAAAMAWLTNRKREEWKHRFEQSIKVNGEAAKLLDDAEKRLATIANKAIQKDGTVLQLVDAPVDALIESEA